MVTFISLIAITLERLNISIAFYIVAGFLFIICFAPPVMPFITSFIDAPVAGVANFMIWSIAIFLHQNKTDAILLRSILFGFCISGALLPISSFISALFSRRK